MMDIQPTTRPTIRCRACGLNQFEAQKCRRCRESLTRPPESVDSKLVSPVDLSRHILPCNGKHDPVSHTLNAKFVGERVKKFRMAKGMSQQELALATKTWRTYISKIERGTTQPFFDQVYRLAKALGVHPANLVASDRELFIRELLADSFVAEISRIALAPWQRSTILNYARDLAGGD